MTEPEPGFVPLSERLGRPMMLLRKLRGTFEGYHGLVAEIDDSLATIDDAIEALQMGIIYLTPR